MKKNKVLSANFASRGFTLIASLLLLVMLSGFAIALLMMVNTEQRTGGNDLQNNYVFHSAEGAVEKATNDLANVFQNIQSPTPAAICDLSTNPGPPTWDPTVTYTTYNIAPVPVGAPSSCPPLSTVWGQIQSGPNAGLYAQLIPVEINVQAQRNTGETASMTRSAEIALIPVFQFGVFCDGDCFFGRSPNLGFAGRVHTNGDLYLGVADGYNLVFGDKISAFGNVIREQMDNTVASAGNDNGGTVMIPTTSGGCAAQLANVAAATPSATCVDIANGWPALGLSGLGSTYGSVEAGHASTQNPAWINVSTGTYNSYIIDGNGPTATCKTCDGPNNTGATDLTLPFVQGTTSAVQIIRRPPPGESTSSLLGGSRLANEAQIRILLSDTEDGLRLSDWNGDPTQDIQLVSALPTSLANLLQASDSGNPGIVQAGSIQVGSTYPPASGHYYSFGESYCTGSGYNAATTIGTAYNLVDTNVVLAGTHASGNYIYDNYNGTTGNTARECPTITGYGTYNGTIATVTDNNFVIPPYYGSPSQVWPPAAYPQWPPQTLPVPSAANFTTPNGGTNGLEWPLVGGWLLVEVKYASDEKWHGVTQEWLKLGFARGVNVPTQPGLNCVATQYNANGYDVTTNTLKTANGCNSLGDHRNAILYFQMTKDSNLAGEPSTAADYPLTGAGLYWDPANCGTTPLPLCKSQYNWYPLNFYDAREGENNDNQIFTASTGTPNGIMNAVELDVGNLRNWLLGNTGISGPNVDYTTQNGYILYFSDRRGMQFANPAGAHTTQSQWGEYGYEDTVNYVNAANNFKPNGALEPNNYNGVSPEDVNSNTVLDNYGALGVGDAFGPATTTDTDVTNPPSPFAQAGGIAERVPLTSVGVANRVTGARHVLKLVDGSLGNLPTMPPASGCSYTNATTGAAQPTGCGGFTVASENPVYILGNYNSNCPAAGSTGCTLNNATLDATWNGGAEPNHSAASVIADAVTMLSNNWLDTGCIGGSAGCPWASANSETAGSMVNPFNPGGQGSPAQTPNRVAITTYYRAAVAAGKTIAFANAAQNPEFSFGMDGGVHNFLRFNEDWGGTTGTQASLYYKGSLVSLYWNQYATGTFKCCNLVYNPPDREYVFDPLFSLPQNLPPGTPMFRNVDDLSYRQNMIARTN
jgi:Tfp pilus assembly protein PilX